MSEFPVFCQPQLLFQSGITTIDSISGRQVRLDYDFERDSENKLYVSSSKKLIFQKPASWNYALYEIYNEEFILITDISTEMSVFSVYEYLAKYEVVIIDLKNVDRQYKCNLRGADILEISKKSEELYVRLGEPINQIIKCSLFSD